MDYNAPRQRSELWPRCDVRPGSYHINDWNPSTVNGHGFSLLDCFEQFGQFALSICYAYFLMM